MAASVKTNFAYTLINTLSGLLFPLITFPYVSRIILPEGIGLVSFYNSVIGYVILLTNLGIPVYGIKEISRVRDNPYELNKTAKEILILNLCTCIVGYAAIFFLSLTVPQLNQNLPLFLLLSLSIILTTIGTPWFFSGIEDFKYITIRGLFVRIVSVILLFIFVKTKEDLIYYAAYIVLAQVGNNAINFYRFLGYMSLYSVQLKNLNPFKHLRAILNIFVFNLITSIYLKLDITMLGFLKEPTNVGYYTSASNLVHIFLSLVMALGQATMPRLSNLLGKGDIDSFSRLAQKSFHFVICVSLPLSAGIIILAPSIIRLFCGPAFDPAINTIRILSFVIIAIGISNLIGIQILYPLGKVSIINYSVGLGATVNVIFNILLIPMFAQDGAAYSTIIAEFSVTLFQITFAKRYISFDFFNKSILCYLTGSIIMSIACWFFVCLRLSNWANIIIIPIIGFVIYGGILYVVRDNFFIEMVSIIKKSKKNLINYITHL